MKVAILTPVHSDPKYRYTQCLADLICHTGCEVRYFIEQLSMLEMVRTNLVIRAANWEADWILWIDSDQTFPPDTLDRLLAHDEPIVGCNVARKVENMPPTAHRARQWVGRESGLGEVDTLGFGVLLTRRDVYQKTPGPWFRIQFDEKANAIGEDAWFCRQARKAGFRIMCDHDLSREIGHIGEKIYTL